jgi:hypothetical protein
MSTTSKGTKWAKKVDALMREIGFVRRRAWRDAGDDMTVTLPVITLSVEAKDHRTYKFSEWVDQAVRQAGPHEIPIVVAHRMGKADAEDGYVVLRGEDFVRLMKATWPRGVS